MRLSRRSLLRPLALMAAVLTLTAPARPADKGDHSAVRPVPRDEGWMKRHEGFVAIAKKGDVGVLFLGDSITDGWRGREGTEAWKKHFDPLKAANFGIGGDRTQHVLWRITNGELEGISPKAAVLMIGTNNSNGTDNTAEEIADGIRAIVKTLREKLPETKILLLAVFPRGEKPNPQREKIDGVNRIVAKLDDGKMVRYLDIGPKFLEPDGTISKDVMPDFLHLSQKGYQIWADAIDAPLKEMVPE